MYTAYCPELDVASCGSDVEQARKNLLEVIEIQLEETAKLGTLKAFFECTQNMLSFPHSRTLIIGTENLFKAITFDDKCLLNRNT